MRTQIALIFLLSMCAGCARTAVVQSWIPAPIDIARLRTLAVLEFGGEQGAAMSDTLTAQLQANRFYTVADRSVLEQTIQTAAHIPGTQTPLPEVLRFARENGIDALLLADVTERRCVDEVIRRAELRLQPRGEDADRSYRLLGTGVGLAERDSLVRTGVVTISFRLVDVDGHEVRADERVSHQYRGEQRPGQEPLPTAEEVLAQLTQRCLDEIVTRLAPHQAEGEMELARGDIWNRGRTQVRQGIMHAHAGNWEAAEREWRSALREDPGNHAALFNLALAATHSQDYAAAEELAMQALRIQHRATYAQGLEAIRARRDGYVLSQDQQEASAAGPAAAWW